MKFLEILAILSVCFVGGSIAFSRVKFVNLEPPRAVKQLGEEIKKTAMVYDDPSDISIYYSVIDNHTIKDMMPRPWIRPGQSLRLPFIGEPCACSGLQCGCCAGVKIAQINIDYQVCANLTYDPQQFALLLDVTINGNVVLHNVYSARNPPPFCIPVVISGIPTGIDFCIKLYDIYLPGNKIHVCIDFETRIASAPVLVLHFDCVLLGFDGIAFVKPDDSPSMAAPLEIDDGMSPTTANVIYDEVFEMNSPMMEKTTLNPHQHAATKPDGLYMYTDDKMTTGIPLSESSLIVNTLSGINEAVAMIKINVTTTPRALEYNAMNVNTDIINRATTVTKVVDITTTVKSTPEETTKRNGVNNIRPIEMNVSNNGMLAAIISADLMQDISAYKMPDNKNTVESMLAFEPQKMVKRTKKH